MKLDRNCTNIFTLHYLISLISSITYRHWHKMLLSIVYHYIFFLIINYYKLLFPWRQLLHIFTYINKTYMNKTQGL